MAPRHPPAHRAPSLLPPPLGLLGAALALACTAAPGAGQGLTLRLAPEAHTVRWDDGLGLEDATFFGGGLSLGFGRYVLLKGSYGTAGIVNTAFADAGFRAGTEAVLEENRVRSTLFGASVLFRLGDQRVAPVLSGRGGILSLEPEGRDRARQIVAGYGAGLDLRLAPWVDGQILVERLALRLDREHLTRPGAPAAPDPDRAATRQSLALGASLGLRLGASRTSGRADDVDRGFDRLLEGSAEGLLVPLETQVGVVRFDDALGLEDQNTAGVRTGLDLGPYFGLRGSYWRGVTGGFDAFQGVSGWAGEIQFNLGRVTQASPHLILGAGQTRFDDEYLADAGVALEDQNQLIVGAGVGLPLGDRARLTVTLRDHISAAGDLETASSPTDLRHSVGLSAGLSFLLFGRRPGPTRPLPPRTAAAVDSADYRSDQVLAIPLPKEGELYVRYGPGGRTLPGEGAAMDSAAVSLAVMAELSGLLAGGGATLSDSARAALQARVLERLRGLPIPAAPDTAAVADTAVAGAPAADASVAELRRQVEELTRLVRESMVLQAAGGVLRPGTSVTVNTTEPGAGGEGAEAAGEPFLRALEGRLARTSMDDGHGGLALGAEAYLGSLGGDERLVPFVALDAGRNGVETELDGSRVEGSVRTVGVDFGVVRVLPRIGPVWPTAGLFLSASRERVSADDPDDEAALDDRYGGLGVGPGVTVGAAYRPDPAKRTMVTAALRNVWAGSTSRWSLEAGMRLAFGPSPRQVGPFSVGRDTGAVPADTVPGPGAVPGTPEAAAEAPTPAPDSLAALNARLDSLEARVLRETEARQRAQARADSLAADAAARARATQRAAAEAAARREDLLGRLDSLALASDVVLGVTASDTLVRVVLGGELFAVGATGVGGSAREEIAALAPLLGGLEPVGVSVEGHTDDTGTEEANLAISRMRAEAVRRALVDGGLPAGAVASVGRGEASPVADNATREGRARNRRVEVLVRLGG